MKRNIIRIDESKCTGCGQCIPNCPEGAIQLIDGKARLVSDLFCDGLGACLGHCPAGAISVESREAEPYDEKRVMENVVRQGPNVIRAHLESHGQQTYLRDALAFLEARGIARPLPPQARADTPRRAGPVHAGCPGSRATTFGANAPEAGPESGTRASQLRHWPVQLHLVSPQAPQYHGADVLLCADCVAYALADFHKDHLKGKALAIACPKLDDGQEVYAEKIRALIDEAQISSLTVMTMEMPCCRGLLNLAVEAASSARRKVPIKSVVVGIEGDVLGTDA